MDSSSWDWTESKGASHAWIRKSEKKRQGKGKTQAHLGQVRSPLKTWRGGPQGQSARVGAAGSCRRGDPCPGLTDCAVANEAPQPPHSALFSWLLWKLGFLPRPSPISPGWQTPSSPWGPNSLGSAWIHLLSLHLPMCSSHAIPHWVSSDLCDGWADALHLSVYITTGRASKTDISAECTPWGHNHSAASPGHMSPLSFSPEDRF